MATSSTKTEYPPLLKIGRHQFQIAKLKSLCVSGFPLSTTRRKIFRGLIQVLRVLRASGAIGELWINGSYLTQKIDPDDVDVVLRMDGTAYDAAPQTVKDAIDWLSTDLVPQYNCHTFVLMVWPQNHANHWIGEYAYAYWMKQWGFSRTDAVKGMAVIQLAKGVV